MHVTCLVHALNRVSECIREKFGNVNALISSTKKVNVFLKAPLCVTVYKEKLEGIPLPPGPVITRWGTWIAACDFYSTNFTAIKEVICLFNASNAVAIEKSQKALKDKNIVHGLTYIKTNFSWLPEKNHKIGSNWVDSGRIIRNC